HLHAVQGDPRKELPAQRYEAGRCQVVAALQGLPGPRLEQPPAVLAQVNPEAPALPATAGAFRLLHVFSCALFLLSIMRIICLASRSMSSSRIWISTRRSRSAFGPSVISTWMQWCGSGSAPHCPANRRG